MSKAPKDKVPMRTMLASLYNLTMMQLKEKLKFSMRHNRKKTLFALSFFVIGFAVVTVICYFLIFGARKLKVFDFNGMFPTNVLVFVFTGMFLLSVVFTTIGLVRSLYFSRDNFVLLTLPTTPSVVFLSKLAVHYVTELRKNFMFLIPLFIAFGINVGYPGYYYPWVVVLFLIVALIPVLLGALLSIPAMYIYQWIRKVRPLQYTLMALGVVGAVALAAYLISIIPSNINLLETWGTTFFQIRHFLESFERIVMPLTLLVRLMVGRQGGSLFTLETLYLLPSLLGAVALLMVLCFLLSKPLFYSMATKPFEFKKNMQARVKTERKLSPFLAVCKKEWLMSLRDSSLAGAMGQMVVIMPLSIALLNSLYNAMNTRFLGTQLTVCFNLLVVMLFMLSANIRMASAYSKDGASEYLNKLQPSSCGSLLFAKLTINLAVGALGLVVTTVVYSLYGALKPAALVEFALIIYAVYVAHLFGSAQMDLMNSQAAQYATFAQQSNNPNEGKSGILVFVLSFIIAGFWMALSMENATSAWWKVLIVALAYMGIKIFFYFLKIKVYYKEK